MGAAEAAAIHIQDRDAYARRVLDHLATVIDLGDDPVGLPRLVKGDGSPCPFDGCIAAADVLEHVTMPVDA